MQSIKEMVDVNTIVGDAVQSPDGTVIIPISKVSFGFAAGGGEYSEPIKALENCTKFPFAGGSGAGVSINPVAFMVVGQNQVKLLPVNMCQSSLDKVIGLVPGLIEKANGLLKSRMDKSKNTTSDVDDYREEE